MEASGQNLKYQKIIVIVIVILLLLISVAIYLSKRPVPPNPRYQKAQFNAIQVGIEFFNNENNGYPPSDALDPAGQPYCGAMKLSEAMMGRDLLGFHPDSVFRADGMDATNTKRIYPISPTTENVKARLDLFLQYETANAYRLLDIYGSGKTSHFNENHFVLSDVYWREMETGNRTGMPILYYKANTANTEHDVNNPDNPKNIFNYKDNHTLVGLGVPWNPKKQHPLFINPKIFYMMTRDWKENIISRPNRSDSYILISAGFDGLYGTKDDICNFDWKYRE
jgi:hypothetical protein